MYRKPTFPSPTGAKFRPLHSILLLLVGMIAASAPRAAWAQISGPWPPMFGAYWWEGPDRGNGSGNGSTDVWNNWDGRWEVDTPPPPTVIVTLPAQNGDELIIDNSFLIGGANQNAHHSISFGGHSLPASNMEVYLNASYSGGSLTLHNLSFQNSGNAHGPLDPYPIDVSGTTMSVDALGVTANTDDITFNDITVGAATINLAGFPAVDQVGTPAVNFNSSQIAGSVVNFHGNAGFNFTTSTLDSLGLNIGFDGSDLDAGPVVTLHATDSDIAQFIVVGAEGGGKLHLEAASHVTAADAYVNVGDNGDGELHITGASTLEADSLNVGLAGTGDVAVDTGGRLTTATGTVGALPGFEGTVNLENDAVWQTEDLKIGDGGTGYVFVREGGELDATGDTTIGSSEFGDLNVSAGGIANLHALTLGEESDGDGALIVTGTGSQTSVNGDLTIGSEGHGAVNVENAGTLSVSGDITLGEESGGRGELTISTGGNLLATGDITVGAKGAGTFALQANSHYTASSIKMGETASGIGHLNIDGGSSLQILHDFTAGDNGAASINVTNGSTLGTDAEATLGDQLGSNVLASVETASQWQALNLTVGSRGIVTFNVLSGGQVHALGDVTLAELVGSVVTMKVDGTGSAVHAESLNVGGSDAIAGGTATLNVTNHGHVYVAGRVSTWSGSKLHLDGGGVTIGSATTPAVDGSVRIDDEGVLAGSGLIQGNVLNAAGEIAPGSELTPGKLTIDGTLTEGADGAIRIRIGGHGAADYDQLSVTGAAALAGAIHLTTINGFILSPGDSFSILSFASASGAFNSLDLPHLSAGLNWDTSHLYTTGVLSVAGIVALPGDYNNNGVVDAADYVAWRNDPSRTQLQYDTWRTHFGQTAGSGAGVSMAAAVPEPTILATVAIASAALGLGRRRQSPRASQTR